MDLEQAIQQKNMIGEGSESQLYHSQPGGNMNNMNNGGDMAWGNTPYGYAPATEWYAGVSG